MSDAPPVAVDHDAAAAAIAVTIDGEPFTTLRYGDGLTKPVLHPIVSSAGATVTRGYPTDPRPGERVDHDHHVGSWLNYGHVNGHDLWNDAGDDPLEETDDGGIVRLDSVDLAAGGAPADDAAAPGGGDAGEVGIVETTATWVTPDGEQLRETTAYEFGAGGPTSRYVDRTTTLTALDGDVALHDDKEGLFAVRVATGLELPTDGSTTRIDTDGEVREVETAAGDQPDGDYYTAAGVDGSSAWGTRAKWVRLAGDVGGDEHSVTIMDHPENVGHPTWWHARHYGLFAANPLAPSVFSGGEFETMNYELAAGEATTFRFRLAVDEGEPSGQALEERWRDWAGE